MEILSLWAPFGSGGPTIARLADGRLAFSSEGNSWIEEAGKVVNASLDNGESYHTYKVMPNGDYVEIG